MHGGRVSTLIREGCLEERLEEKRLELDFRGWFGMPGEGRRILREMI